jgi:AraC-like DNA-binding protein
VEMDAIWNTAIHSIRGAILNTTDIDSKFTVLENYFLQKKKRESNPLVDYAVSALKQAPHVWTIEKLSQKTGVTGKHLISLFKKYVGLSPKQFAKITRFQKVIQLIEKQQTIEWTSLAYECGYYDQAHFIHEFRAFSGINPSAYLVQRGEYINYLPVS